MVLIDLFLAFFRIGLFAIGGAYSFLPLIEKEAVERFHWLTKPEFLDILGVVQMFPGAISIKFATYTGYKIAGVPGAIAANLGNLLAPALLILFATVFYARFSKLPGIDGAFNMIQLAVFAMIVAVAFQLIDASRSLHFKNLIVIIVVFFVALFTKIHPALIIIVAGVLGALLKY